MTNEQYFAQFTGNSRNILRGYIESVEDVSQVSVDGIVAYQNQALSEMTTGATKYLGMLKNIGMNLLLVIGSQLAFKAVDYIWENLPFTEKHKQKITEYADKAMQTLDEGLSKTSEDMSTVESIEEGFKKLSAGVSRTGENLSLTNEQYETYKNYVEQLIQINPQLVEGINAQGDAFINNATAIEDTIQLLKEQRRETYAAFFNGTDNKNVLENLINERKEINNTIDEIFGKKRKMGLGGNLTSDDSGIHGGILSEFDSLKLRLDREKNQDAVKELKEVANRYGISYDEIIQDTEAAARRIDSGYSELNAIAKKYGSTGLAKALSRNREYLSQLDQQYDQQESVDKKFDEYVDRYAKSQEKYWNLSTQQQKIVDSFIQDYNFFDKATKKGSDAESAERQMQVDVENYLDFLDGLSDKITSKMSELQGLDKSSLTYQDYTNKVNEAINEIINDPTYDESQLPRKELRLQLGVDFETNDGEIVNQYDDMIEKIINRFKKDLPANENWIKTMQTIKSQIQGLTLDQITQLYKLEDFSGLNTWNDILEKLSNPKGFDISLYKDSIEGLTKDLTTLGEALKKVKMGELTPDKIGSTKEVLELAKEYPELAKYVDLTKDRFGDLEYGLTKLIKAKPEPLLKTFKDLGALTAEARKECDFYGDSIRKLRDDALGTAISAMVQYGATESDYLSYVEYDYDKIIKKLEEQKEATEDVNDSLEDQKEKLEKIVDEYEIAGNTVIKTLEDKIEDVTKYYDDQIDKLKEENEELERSIDLQEKKDALANARKTRVRVYSETQGWHYELDAAAVDKAEKDLAKSEREAKIADLEKERDAEIKLWEDYKEAWQDAMDAYTKAHDEAITDGILGTEWREKVIERDEDMLNTYQENYTNFKNQLDDNIDEQIKKNKEYTDSIDKKIKQYQKDKQAMHDWVEEQNHEKLNYFKIIDDIKITEKSTWDERIKNFEEFKNNYKLLVNEIAQANNEAQIPDEPKIKLNTNSSFRNAPVAKEYLGKEYSTREEAEKARKELANKITDIVIKSQYKGAMALLITDKIRNSIRDRILEEIKLDAVGSYANGGVISSTGIAQVHGTPSKSEVALSSSQARTVYDFISSGAMDKATKAMTNAYNLLINALPKPTLNGVNLPFSNAIISSSDKINGVTKSVTNEIKISFPNATINAKDYDTFKNFMDTYTNDLLLKMQVGL